ncbi:hypothetical protein FB45DRAFT_1037154 [Roridomyces roridus]|uniref:Uncharacterized protein n=1 Tax=Roridomyces roridus TaxID=1738132 RepID=A0AAD7B7C0_9AGAR|nr:hypothetical protein FB45DRAFT_1037154 [Roridomyces roridus]
MFPPEVVDRIVHALHDDYDTLRLCGLINRDWMAASRYHFLNGKRRMQLTHHNLPLFLDLLGSPFNTFSTRLERLRVKGVDYTTLKSLWSALPHFSHLRELQIGGHFFDPVVDVALLGPEAQIFPRVTSLAIARIFFSSYGTLNSFLARVTSLSALKIEGLRDIDKFETDINADHQSSHRLQLHLTSLHLELGPAMLAWLKWSGFCLRAREGHLNISHTSSFPIVSEYLSAAQFSRLTLRVHSSNLLLLQYPPSLIALCLLDPLWMSGSQGDLSVSLNLLPFLRQISLSIPGLQELAFCIVTLPFPNLAAGLPPTHEEVTSILDGAGFAGLRRLEFLMSRDIGRDELRATLESILPMQFSRGIVRLGVEGPGA